MARTTRTATTVWIGPTTVDAASPVWAPRRSFAVVLWRHVPTQHLSLSGQREGSPEEPSSEELLAGAHGASLAIAVSAGLTAARHPPVRVRVEAACELDEAAGDEHRIARMSLTVSAIVPSIDDDEFNRIVAAAALSCPISRALRCNVEIDIDQRLE